MGVKFVSVKSERGNTRATGPVTGAEYLVEPTGTPVSEHDYEGILAVLGDPCCGKALPFDGKVRVFLPHSASARQVREIPQWVYDLKPVAVEVKAKPKKDLKSPVRTKPEREAGRIKEEE